MERISPGIDVDGSGKFQVCRGRLFDKLVKLQSKVKFSKGPKFECGLCLASRQVDRLALLCEVLMSQADAFLAC